MDVRRERPTRGWRIDLDEPPEELDAGAAAALARAAEEIANLRRRAPGPEDRERAAVALRSAALLGANEHELAVVTGLPLEHVRELLRGA